MEEGKSGKHMQSMQSPQSPVERQNPEKVPAGLRGSGDADCPLALVSLERTAALCREYVSGGERQYLEEILDRLETFRQGRTCTPFRFTLALYEGRNVRHLDISCSGDCLDLWAGGFVYSSQIGGDTYLDWQYSLFLDGDHAGTLGLDPADVRKLLDQGARLVIGF